MKGFFEAKSVAVIGVSPSPANMGRAIVYNLVTFGFPGVIYPVGPRGGAFMGHKIYASVLDIPDQVDLAAILTPAPTIPGVLRQCGEKGIERVVIESSGFREFSDDRISLEQEILKIANRYGIRFVGPNGIGLINMANGLAVPFMPFEYEYPKGNVAILAQSGGIGSCMLNAMARENVGFSKFVSMGNKLNIDENDLIEYLENDPETRTIFVYLEGISDGRKLLELASKSEKPIIVFKANNSEASVEIAKSHSASLATDHEVVRAAFKQAGIFEAKDIRDSLDFIKAFQLPVMKGTNLAVVSRSGGHAVVAADAASYYGFRLISFPESILKMVQEHSRAGVIKPQNPLDLGDLFDLPLYEKILEKTLKREEIDGVCFIHNYQGIFEAEASRQLAEAIKPLVDRYDKPITFCLFSTNKEVAINRKRCGVPIFEDPWEALKALKVLHMFHSKKVSPFPSQFRSGLGGPRALELLETVREIEHGKQLPPDLSYRLLAIYGIPAAHWYVADSEEAVVSSAERIGYPVVVKTANLEVIHKSDENALVLNIKDRVSLLEAYTRLRIRFGLEVLIQEYVAGGVEVFAGVKRDRNFGPVMMFGLGGVFVELFKDISRRVAPLSPRVAMEMIEETKAGALLRGFRGGEEADIEACVDLLVRLSYLACDLQNIAEIDLNPATIATGHGKGAKVLDCRMVWA